MNDKRGNTSLNYLLMMMFVALFFGIIFNNYPIILGTDLSKSVEAGIAILIGALITQITKNFEAKSADIKPSDKPETPSSQEVSQWQEELSGWQDYAKKVDDYSISVEAARLQMSQRQTMLRVSLFGIMGLSFLLCAAGILGPLNPPALNQQIFELHLGYLLLAFILTGGGIGLTIFAFSGSLEMTAHHAHRSAVICSTLLGACVTLVSLPYVIHSQPAFFPLLGLPPVSSIIWLMLIRMIIGPILCAMFAVLSFSCLRRICASS